MLLGARLKKLREDLKLSQRDFVKPLSISQSDLSKIEGGRKKMYAAVLKEIISVYGVSEQWLDEGKGNNLIQLENHADENDPFLAMSRKFKELERRLEKIEKKLDK